MPFTTETIPESEELHQLGTLDYFLQSLDDFTRDDHLGTIQQGVRSARAILETLTPILNTCESSFATIEQEYHRERSEALNREALQQQLQQQQQALQGLVRNPPSVIQLEQNMEYERSIMTNLRSWHGAFTRFVDALDNMSSLWELLWDVYDMITNPGPSTAPQECRELWAGWYRQYLRDSLAEIEGRMDTAIEEMAEFDNILGILGILAQDGNGNENEN